MDAKSRNRSGRLGAAWQVLKDSAREWSEDKVPRLGAALAFYCALSLAPLLIIVIAIAGFVFGAEAAQGQVLGELRGLVGEQGGKALEEMIANAREPKEGTIAAILGVVTLLFAASGIFAQLQDALNTIWGVRIKPNQGIWKTIRDRFLSFGMVLVFGFLLLVSLVLSAALHAFGEFSAGALPGSEALLSVLNYGVSFAVVTVLFATLFKKMPDVKIRWRDVWIGAVLTSLLFVVGKFAIGMYLGRASVGSAYGAAGSFVVLLLWLYYSAQILLFGAEFTQVYANRFGDHVAPAENAELVPEEARANQGMKANSKR